MMKYMLDTNICIYLIKKHLPEIVHKFDTYRKGEIVISGITWAELCCGLSEDANTIVEKLLSLLKICPFGIEQGHWYGKLSRQFPNRKANLNRMIAAHALLLNITLVTNNVSDFAIYQSSGLHIENWVEGYID